MIILMDSKRNLSLIMRRLMKNTYQKSLRWNLKEFRVLSSRNFLTPKTGNSESRLLYLSAHTCGKKVEFYGTKRNFCTNSSGFRVSDEVRKGVSQGEAIVALESAIITHGMPFPTNIETALRLHNIIREQGAIPATVGVIKGQLTVGLSDEEIECLGRSAISDENASCDSPVIKVSRRDLPFALSQRLNGGTTVSGTIVGAVKAGIPIFATGGLGGVHRRAEKTFDISADLRELGRNPIAIVSAGVKSILDIGKTLEYLETEGVCVAVLKKESRKIKQGTVERNNNDHASDADADDYQKDHGRKYKQIGRVKFPSFFTAESQFTAPYSLDDELQAAHLVNSSINFGLGSGILIAVPIPKEHEAEGHKIEKAIEKALEKAENLGIHGKDMTPFLLLEINRLTSGSSLSANKCLIENNVRVATQIAILLAKLRRTGLQIPPAASAHSSSPAAGGYSHTKPDGSIQHSSQETTEHKELSQGNILPQKEYHERFIDSSPSTSKFHKNLNNISNTSNLESRKKSTGFPKATGRPVVIGGSSMDLIMSVEEKEIVSDGRTHKTKIRTAAGGVGRNIAEALTKLGHNPILISTIGTDLFGRELMRDFQKTKMDTSKVFTTTKSPTAIYSALLNHRGECVFGLGDMSIHSQLSSEVIIEKCQRVIQEASIVILDGNLTVEAINSILKICIDSRVPVWFEPTEVRKAKKILEVSREYWPGLSYISPNIQELMSITEIDLNVDLSKETNSLGTNITSNSDLSQKLHSLFSRCFDQFTGLEVILFTRGKQGISVISRETSDVSSLGIRIISHPAPDLQEFEIKSVSGAGDCLTAGMISGILDKISLSECAIRGTFCAKKSLQSIYNVPQRFYNEN